MVVLPQGWQSDEVQIQRIYELGSFQQAIAFVQTVADLSESASQEPELVVRHNRVIIILPASSASTALAHQIERAAQAYGAI